MLRLEHCIPVSMVDTLSRRGAERMLQPCCMSAVRPESDGCIAYNDASASILAEVEELSS